MAAAAAVTDEVSFTAVPANRPKPSLLMPSALPSEGKIRAASTLNRKMTEMAWATSLSCALMTGAVAAMAEPPQMDEPTPMSVEISEGMRSTLCSKNAVMSAVAMVEPMMGSDIMPTWAICARFSPKPSSTTAACSTFLPLNAMPVSIDKNVYAANLLNTLAYQDLDGYHVGKTAFAFDQGRQDAGYREENCWYTTGELIRSGAASYGTALEGSNTPLFRFGTREEVAPENRSGMSLTVTFSKSDSEQLNYNTGTGLYEKLNADGSPMTDADNGQQAAFTNVFVLYASSGIKDDGYTRQYDMTGGTGLYLHGGAWEQISWSKEDATGPFSLTAADGTPLTVAPGKSFIAIWGGYYGQALRLTAADGSEQTLPEKPALLASGVTDEAAAAAEAALSNAQKLIDAQAAIDQANASLAEAQTELQDAQAALDADSENADLLAARDAAQAKIDELNQTIADNQAYLDANAPQPEETPVPEATEAPAE